MSVSFSENIQLDNRSIVASVKCEICFAAVANDVLQLMNSGSGDARRLGALITSDQSLTARVLKLANSPFYGFPRKINTVRDAVVVLGDKALRNMVLAMAVKGLSANQGPVERGLWEESAAFAIAARFIATKIDLIHPEEAFMAGLMSNIGETVCNLDTPKLYRRILTETKTSDLRQQGSAALLPYPFTQLGAAILYDWNFSPMLVASTFYAETAELTGDRDDESFMLCCVVRLARQLCKSLGLGCFSEQPALLSAEASAVVLGFDGEAVNALRSEFADVFAETAAGLINS
ncbi:MAG: HDOD domain-containing protein [Deltaproteobacteria bacterium]|nr:HDOD domain-containing protein [Deltaproteobacteria bacterium]